MPQDLLLGLDIGTSSVKGLLALVKPGAPILATVITDYQTPPRQPRTGWSEHDPEQWWTACQQTIAQLCRNAKRKPAEIRSIGLSGQMHGSVFLDRGGAVIRPALLWNDQRTTDQCARIEQAAGGRDTLIRLVKNPALTGYTAPKILWLRDREPKHFAKLAKVLLPKDYIRYRLSAATICDVSDASGTLLLDIDRRIWSTELLNRLDLPAELLPDLCESTDPSSTVNGLASRMTGIEQGVPIAGGAGDQPAGAVGNGIVSPGVVSATLGTSGVLFAHADAPVPNPQGALQSFCHAVPAKWCVFGCMLSAGGSLQWLRNNLGQPEIAAAKKLRRDAYDLLIEQAATAPPGAAGLYFLPYLTGERCPYPDPAARGGWIGLTASHNRAHLIRAVVEGITYGLKDQVELMRQGGVAVNQIRASGGGARSRWWCQLMADIFDAEIVTTTSTEGGAYGAALLAGVACGAFATIEAACAKAIRITRRWKPNAKRSAAYRRHHETYRQLYADLRNTFPRMAT